MTHLAKRPGHTRHAGMLGATVLTAGLLVGLTTGATGEPHTPVDSRSWERALQAEVDADSAARLSEALSTYPGLTGTEGAARRAAYSIDMLTSWGLDARVRATRSTPPSPRTSPSR